MPWGNSYKSLCGWAPLNSPALFLTTSRVLATPDSPCFTGHALSPPPPPEASLHSLPGALLHPCLPSGFHSSFSIFLMSPLLGSPSQHPQAGLSTPHHTPLTWIAPPCCNCWFLFPPMDYDFLEIGDYVLYLQISRIRDSE